MLNILLTIAIIMLFITNVIFLAWIRSFKDRIRELNARQEYCIRLSEINNDFSNRMHDLMDGIIKIDNKRDELVETIVKSYDSISNQYTDILKTDQKLMEIWEKIEERYSDSYEQFLKCDDAIRTAKAELHSQMTMRTHDILAAMPMHCPAFNVPDEEFQNERYGPLENQVELLEITNFNEPEPTILVGNILDEEWDVLKEEYKNEILEAGSVDADRLGEMILDSRKEKA